MTTNITTDWKKRVKGLLKSELKRKSLTYEDLAIKLNQIGIKENAVNLNIKISRGTFNATFFIQCLDVIGCKNLKLED